MPSPTPRPHVRRATGCGQPAPERPRSCRPVARVVVDSPLAHLDRPFDYLVPTTLDADVVPGLPGQACASAGRLVDAFVRRPRRDQRPRGRARVPEPRSSRPSRCCRRAVLGLVPRRSPIAGPARSATSCGWRSRRGTHARRHSHPRWPPTTPLPAVTDDAWPSWPHGASFLAALAAGERPRACWAALPAHDPAAGGRRGGPRDAACRAGSIVCVPDVRDVARWDETFTAVLGEGRHVVLTAVAEAGRALPRVPGGRARRGAGRAGHARRRVRAGGGPRTRRDVRRRRRPLRRAARALSARPRGAAHSGRRRRRAVLLGGHARTAESQALVESGWCSDLVAEPVTRRRRWPTVEVTDGDRRRRRPARLPHAVFRAIRGGRRPGARPGARGAAIARRWRASGAARRPAARSARARSARAAPAQAVACRWCGHQPSPWTCPRCGGHELRAPSRGHVRTAEEYAEGLPRPPGRHVGRRRRSSTAVEPGAGHRARHAGRGAARRRAATTLVVLHGHLADAGRATTSASSRSPTGDGSTRSRWLARPRRPSPSATPAPLQALVRADPVGLASRELAVRAETHLPPIGRLATVDGPADVLGRLAERTLDAEHRGARAGRRRDDGERLVLRAPRREGADAGCGPAGAPRPSAARPSCPAVRVRVDPLTF